MREGYERLTGRRRTVVFVFGALVVINCVSVLFSMIDLNLLDRVESGELVADDEIAAHDARIAAVGGLQTLAYIVCGIVFIRWLRAAYRNLDLLAPGVRRYGHGWAIGAWFVPFLSLWRPKQIMNDVWRGSGTPTDCGRPPLLLLAWWLSWIAGLILGRFALRSVFEQDTIEQLRTIDFWYIVSDSWDAANAVMAISVVRYLTRRLDHRATVTAADASSSEWTGVPAAGPENTAEHGAGAAAAGAENTAERGAASLAGAVRPGVAPVATPERPAARD